ncbi:hypothetical protein CONPUDRAFT_169270 [Coniophora puteana RWD-64-598 SS2]|uniref:Uncharacterized protein n=1 Tax=Coniophora puteana (strain RWD-64-598) TaxID=741705 RepID=A0A5M3MBS6_CONPW|nr:uncharacterized protein CONPUDRAFT_169270 [Coniophora puteana RWD-64-598 SS2]EIW76085.1 hypothetical protein CONPUDRAFT_169270 [Coniophora puteana RWD-64-598 SS2]
MHLSTLFHIIAATVIAVQCFRNPFVTLTILSAVTFITRDQGSPSSPKLVEPGAPTSTHPQSTLDHEKSAHDVLKEQTATNTDRHDTPDLEEHAQAALAFRAGAAEARIEVMEMEHVMTKKTFATYRERTIARLREKEDALEQKKDEIEDKDEKLASLQAQLADARLEAATSIRERDVQIKAFKTERDEVLRQHRDSTKRAADALAQAEVAIFECDLACEVAQTSEEDTTTLMLALAQAGKHAHIAERELDATASHVHEMEKQLGIALAIGAREVFSLKRDLAQAKHELATSALSAPPTPSTGTDTEMLLAALEQERRRADHHMTRADRAELSLHNLSRMSDKGDSELEEALSNLEATQSALNAERKLSGQYLDTAWKYHAVHEEADSSLAQHKEKVSHLSDVVVDVKFASAKLRARCELLENVLVGHDGASEELARREAMEAEAARLRRSEADAARAQVLLMLLIDHDGKVTTDHDAIHIAGQSEFSMPSGKDPLPSFVQHTSADSVKETLSSLASFASSTSPMSIMSSGSFVNLLDLFPMPPTNCPSIPNAGRRPAKRSKLIDSDDSDSESCYSAGGDDDEDGGVDSDESFEAGSISDDESCCSTTSTATATSAWTSASTTTSGAGSMTSAGPEDEPYGAKPVSCSSSSKFECFSSTMEEYCGAPASSIPPIGQYLEGTENNDC